MKQKFTITVADIEMNILSEGTSENVESIVNKVDRRIREICLRSPRISKNEAALLCSLELCSELDIAQKDLGQNDGDYDALKEENAKLNDTVNKLEARFASLKEKYESSSAAQKEKYETAAATQKEKYEGRINIMKEKYESRINSLKAKLDEMKKVDNTASAQQQICIEIEEDNTPAEIKPEETVSADEKNVSEATLVEEVAAEAQPATEDKKETRGKGKNKVGSMFDLLTFNDV